MVFSRPLKIVFLFVSMPVGGAEDFALGVYPHLGPEIQARFVCLRELGTLGEEALSAGLPVECLDLFRSKRINPFSIWRLSRWLRRAGVDAVHSQTHHAHIFGVAAARLAGILSVVHQQKTLEELPARKRFLLRRCLHGADAVIALSAETRTQMQTGLGIPVGKIHVVPNAVDTSVFQPACDTAEARRALGLAAEGFTLCCVGSMHPVKNHGAIIEALGILLSRGQRPPRVVFVGDGPARPALESLGRGKGVGDRIVFAGRQRPVVPWLHAADAFVLASAWEGQPLAMLQAISCGLPVLASRIEGNTAILGAGHPGLFEPRDAHALADLISTAMEPGGKRGFMVAPGAAGIPSTRQAAAQLKAVYRSLQ
jgi:glycosyltransferase involved in cell wall biosynthesis